MLRPTLVALALSLPAAAALRAAPLHRAAVRPPRRHPPLRCAADFSGEWEMDLGASDPLGPVLRELGLPRVLAAVVARLAVRQTISQDAERVVISVKTVLSTDELELRLDGAPAPLPALSGARVDAVSAWADEGATRLETRQKLEPAGDPADAFVTVRSLRPDGALCEEVSVVRAGVAVAGASARRILRRRATT